jgi:hypothetical protein
VRPQLPSERDFGIADGVMLLSTLFPAFVTWRYSPIFPPGLCGNFTAAWASLSFWPLRVSPAALAGRTQSGF